MLAFAEACAKTARGGFAIQRTLGFRVPHLYPACQVFQGLFGGYFSKKFVDVQQVVFVLSCGKYTILKMRSQVFWEIFYERT